MPGTMRRFTPLRMAIAAGVTATLPGCAGADDPQQTTSESEDTAAIRATIAKLDQVTLPAETLADLYLDDAVILQPGQEPVSGRAEIIALMEAQAAGPALDMTHRIDELTLSEDVMVVQGGVSGTASPADGSGPFPFETQNVILFKRDQDGSPKIWKVIFNMAPPVAEPE